MEYIQYTMTKDPEYKNWNPELIRRHKEYKRKQQEIRDYHADLMEQHKEQYREKRAGILARQYQHYPENRPWPGAPTLFPGEGSLTSDGLNSLQRAEVGEHPTEATLPMSDKKKKPNGIFTSVTTPKPKKQKKPKEGYTQTFQGQQKQATSPSCESCGNTLKPTAKFCGSCGTRID
jgi:hypothetical protein